MRVDFRHSSRGTAAYVNALYLLHGECYWNGIRLPDVAVADTETGQCAVLVKDEHGRVVANNADRVLIHWMPIGTVVIVAKDGTRFEAGQETAVARSARIYDFAVTA